MVVLAIGWVVLSAVAAVFWMLICQRTPEEERNERELEAAHWQRQRRAAEGQLKGGPATTPAVSLSPRRACQWTAAHGFGLEAARYSPADRLAVANEGHRQGHGRGHRQRDGQR
jgi:hypothetical protein